MNWATVANLILELGLPAAERIIENWENKQAVTLAEFKAIRAQAEQTAADIMKQRLISNGIDPDSEEGKRLLALVSAPTIVTAKPPEQPPVEPPAPTVVEDPPSPS